MAKCCAAADLPLGARGTPIDLSLTNGPSHQRKDHERHLQSYRLSIEVDGSVRIESPSPAGLQHGIVTFCQIVEAFAGGAPVGAARIDDEPAFRVRGVMIDSAREFFPPTRYLKKIIDRLVRLKLNTLWIYLENNFKAPGLEDLSTSKGMTPEQAKIVSEYGARRGVDVVPATNLVSHMEGWFRLERYSDLCDGRTRSYPLLNSRKMFDLVRRYVDGLCEAFGSRNFHAGLDELLFTGTNPRAAKAIEKKGKAAYYGDFAARIIAHLKARGKTVWMWDDMVLGKNVWRPEGFRHDAEKALRRIPADVIPVHWWYREQTPEHHKSIRRVRDSGRPFVVSPNSLAAKCDYGDVGRAARNQTYLARTGLKHGAFGYVCTSWQNQWGSSYEAHWPLLAMSAGQGWSGGTEVNGTFLRRLSFAITGELSGALGRYLQSLSSIEHLLAGTDGKARPHLRRIFIREGAHQLWRRLSPVLSRSDRGKLRRLVRDAREHYRSIGDLDPDLRRALRLPVSLFEESLAIIDAFDRAWAAYHAASTTQREGTAKAFSRQIEKTKAHLRQAVEGMRRFRLALKEQEKSGYTPYDANAVSRFARELAGVPNLIDRIVQRDLPLPYFERLLYLPDCYYASNLEQAKLQTMFFERYPNLPWLGFVPLKSNDQSRRRRAVIRPPATSRASEVGSG